MSINRVVTHLVSVALLLLWGGVLLYFYSSGRITHYLPPDGIFRPMALAAGIGLMVLGIFNLATMGHETGDCCGHDHDADDDHDHANCGHDHKHEHAGCCGHDHQHDHGHDHSHAKGGCCGHDHGHSHTHNHSAEVPHDHAHGILEESGPLGRTIAILILSVPLVVAAAMTPDQFSPNAVINKGVYNTNYSMGSVTPQTRLGSNKPGATAMSAPKGTPAANVASPATTPAVPAPATTQPGKATLADVPASGPRVPGSAAPATASVATTTMAPPPPAAKTGEVAASANTAAAGTAAKSYGTFTLADLKAQVPQSKEGNFILEVPELYYTAGDKEVQGVLAGQMVETTAQVLPEKVNNADGKRLRIFRLLVQCCAADARPYSVPVEFAEKAPALKDMTWVKIVGKMAYKQENGQTVPMIQASSIAETTSPDNAMLY